MKKTLMLAATLILCLALATPLCVAAELDAELTTSPVSIPVSDVTDIGDNITILFLDWDNRIIGSTIAKVDDGDVRALVNAYVEENFVHPELRTSSILVDKLGGELPNFASVADAATGSVDPAERYKAILDSNDREWTYRGKYAYTLGGPDSQVRGVDHAEPGEKYCLTNKLDYVFYRHINIITTKEYLNANGEKVTDRYVTTLPVTSDADAARYPWVYGWALVDADLAEGQTWNAALDMAEATRTWTTFGTAGELNKKTPSYDYAADKDSHNLPVVDAEPSAPAFYTVTERPTKYAYKLTTVDEADENDYLKMEASDLYYFNSGYLKFADFSDLGSNITHQGQNLLIVKAVYEPGTELTDENYRIVVNPTYKRVDSGHYVIEMAVERANTLQNDGFIRGTRRCRLPVIREDLSSSSKNLFSAD